MKNILNALAEAAGRITNITKAGSANSPIEYTGLAVENNEEGFFKSGFVGGGFVGDFETSDSNGYAFQFTVNKPFRLYNLLSEIHIFTSPQGIGLDVDFIFYNHDDSLPESGAGDKFFGNEIIRRPVSFSPEETSTPSSELICRNLTLPFNYIFNPGTYWLEFHISKHQPYQLGVISNIRFEGSVIPEPTTIPFFKRKPFAYNGNKGEYLKSKN